MWVTCKDSKCLGGNEGGKSSRHGPGSITSITDGRITNQQREGNKGGQTNIKNGATNNNRATAVASKAPRGNSTKLRLRII